MSGSMAAQNTPNSGGSAGQQLMVQNAAARQAILAASQNMVQPLFSTTITSPGQANNIVNVSPRLVGFNKRFYVEIQATILNPDLTNDLVLTGFGPSNILSQVVFTDLSNNVRINTTGYHLHQVASVKRGRPFGSAYLTDSPVNFGNNVASFSAPMTIPKGGTNTGVVNWIYEVPLAYSDVDFRGAIWLGVTNATANLALTINPVPVATAGADSTLAVYGNGGTLAGSISSITINVYQNYLDQLPVIPQQGVILPISDISTVYLLNNTTQSGMVANQDFPVPYANFRDFLSTFVVFDNGGTLNAGTDVNYWAEQAANYVNMIKVDPKILSMFARNMVQDDFPTGCYYFSHRHKPISTIQYGNRELVLNASTVNSNAKLFVCYEQFALINLVAQAGALAIA
jgi:hypothetical protein